MCTILYAHRSVRAFAGECELITNKVDPADKNKTGKEEKGLVVFITVRRARTIQKQSANSARVNCSPAATFVAANRLVREPRRLEVLKSGEIEKIILSLFFEKYYL